MVTTTTAENAIAPGPASIEASEENCTRRASIATTKTSSIDHLPTNSTMRYSRVRCSGSHVERVCADQASTVSDSSLASGTKMLAVKMMIARS